MGKLGDQAYGAIRRMIIKGLLAPGMRVSEPGLSMQLHLSTAAVRGALTQLRQEGLVYAIPRKGYVITPLTIDGAREIMEVRTALEPRAAFLAAGRLRSEDFRATRRSFKQGYDPRNSQSITDLLAINSNYRKLIANASGNTRLAGLISGLVDEMERYLRLSWETENRAPVLVSGLDEVCDALVKGEAERAQTIMQEQMLETERHILGALSRRREVTGAPLTATH